MYIVDKVSGVTQLHHIVYVVCAESPVIKTFTADALSPFGKDIHVEGMKNPSDIVACRDDRQLYVADEDYCIWRVSAADHSDQEKWLPTEPATDTFSVSKLSVTSRRLLVTSSRSLHEYSTTDRQLLRDIRLPSLFHGVETTRDTFVISQECAVNEQSCLK